jgi:membrane-associated phospholipid phosphatase
LHALSALAQLVPRLVTIAILAVAFMGLTVAISLGWLSTVDHQVLVLMSSIWREQLHPLFQGIALLGGIELTTVVMLAVAIFLYSRGIVADAWVFVALVAAQAFELLYKYNLVHPAPPRTAIHADGPSVSDLFGTTPGPHNSFPSGHIMRTVLVYGLLAFVIRRLAPNSWLRPLAIPLAVVLIVLMAFDRIYLDVHWESDVLGGLLLGAIALVSATVWLDRPRRAEN